MHCQHSPARLGESVARNVCLRVGSGLLRRGQVARRSFSQTAANSANEATETGGVELVEGGTGKVGMRAWVLGVVAAVMGTVAL